MLSNQKGYVLVVVMIFLQLLLVLGWYALDNMRMLEQLSFDFEKSIFSQENASYSGNF